MTDIPAASLFVHPKKVSYLKKLTGRGWFYSGCWKKRYCVLHGTKLYFYESETSQGDEKTAGVISLDYYDLCEEGSPKDNRKTNNVFYIGTSVRGFFDNRHLFSTESTEECAEWIKEINAAIDEARINRSRAGRSKPNGGRQQNVDDLKENHTSESGNSLEIPSSDRLQNVTKDRAKGPSGRRLPQRKSMMPTTNETNKESGDAQLRSTSLSALDGITEDDESDYQTNCSTEAINSRNDSDTDDVITSEEKIVKSNPKFQHKNFGKEHNAFLRELEKKVGVSKHQSETDDFPQSSEENDELATVKNSIEVVRSRMTLLGTQLEHMERNVSGIRKDLNKVQEEMVSVKTTDDRLQKKTIAMEKQMDTVSEKVNTMFETAKKALDEAEQSRREYYNLKEEFREMITKIKNNELLQFSTINVTDEV